DRAAGWKQRCKGFGHVALRLDLDLREAVLFEILGIATIAREGHPHLVNIIVQKIGSENGKGEGETKQRRGHANAYFGKMQSTCCGPRCSDQRKPAPVERRCDVAWAWRGGSVEFRQGVRAARRNRTKLIPPKGSLPQNDVQCRDNPVPLDIVQMQHRGYETHRPRAPLPRRCNQFPFFSGGSSSFRTPGPSHFAGGKVTIGSVGSRPADAIGLGCRDCSENPWFDRLPNVPCDRPRRIPFAAQAEDLRGRR